MLTTTHLVNCHAVQAAAHGKASHVGCILELAPAFRGWHGPSPSCPCSPHLCMAIATLSSMA